MKLLTKEILNTIPALYSQDSMGREAIAYAKFFTPDSDWTWYATEYDPETQRFFGLVCGFEDELGYFTLTELETSKGPLGLPIERDICFTPTKLSKLFN